MSTSETLPDGSVRITTDDFVVTIAKKHAAVPLAAEDADAILARVAITVKTYADLPTLNNAFAPALTSPFTPSHTNDHLVLVFSVAMIEVYQSTREVPVVPGDAIKESLRLFFAAIPNVLQGPDDRMAFMIIKTIKLLTLRPCRNMVAILIENGVVEAIMRQTICYRANQDVMWCMCEAVRALAANASGPQRRALSALGEVLREARAQLPDLTVVADLALDELV